MQVEVAFTFWLHHCCLMGSQYTTSNLDLLEDFGWCCDNYGFRNFCIESEEFDTLLAWAGFHPELRQDCIIWYGIARRFDYWEPDEAHSPHPIFSEILK